MSSRTGRRAIRFGRSIAWHFDLSATHPYEFAFEDWELDPNGFPVDTLNSD